MRTLPFACLLLLNMGGGLLMPGSLSAVENATSSPAARLSEDDADFVQHAWAGGMFEIRSSELAVKRGLSGDERNFANQMITDHTKVNDEIQTLAKSKGVVLPAMLDEKMQKKVDELGKENDKDFAAAYLSCQVDAHKTAVKAFKKASENASDPDVRAFAAKHVSHLESHLTRAKELEDHH